LTGAADAKSFGCGTIWVMDVEKTIEFLLGQRVRFDAQMVELTGKMDLMVDRQIGMDERHDREIGDIRSALRQAVRLSVEEQRRERFGV